MKKYKIVSAEELEEKNRKINRLEKYCVDLEHMLEKKMTQIEELELSKIAKRCDVSTPEKTKKDELPKTPTEIIRTAMETLLGKMEAKDTYCDGRIRMANEIAGLGDVLARLIETERRAANDKHVKTKATNLQAPAPAEANPEDAETRV